MKVDLRILFCGNTNRPDLSVGEFAKKAIPCKLYHDKLKQVVITKYHLNALLLSGLSPSAASMPIVHIMGFDFHLSLLRKVDDFYVLEPVDTVAFPTSHKAIKDNGIQKLISCLEKSLCLSQKKANKLMEKAAVKKMVWPSEDEEDEDEDEEDEDDEVEDDNDEDDDQDDDDQDDDDQDEEE